ncbi:hypothetical protein HKX48_001795 [Thoreauomyces humboldtii]|nr:hypothetical protein HKX48_001795 [Thoreauomyces humboldtii]
MISVGKVSLAAAALSAFASSLVAAQNSTDPTVVGAWTHLSDNCGVVPVHMAHSQGGKLYMGERIHQMVAETFALGDGYPLAMIQSAFNGTLAQWFQGNPNMQTFLTDSAEFNVGSNQYTLIDHIPVDTNGNGAGKNQGYAFCGGHAQLANGSYVVVGGDEYWTTPFDGTTRTSVGKRDIRIMNPSVNGAPASLVKVAEIYDSRNLAADDPARGLLGRWYPSVLTLPNEDIITVGGQRGFYANNNITQNVPTYEIFHPATNGGEAPVHINVLADTYPTNLYPVSYILPHSGKLWVQAWNLSSIIDLTTNTETPHVPFDLTQTNGLIGRNFPFVGNNFIPQMSYRNDYKMTAWFCGGVNATSANGTPTARDGGGTNSYDSCSTCQASARCDFLALEDTNPVWETEDMPLARSQSTAVNLPDGTIAIVSGSAIGHQGGTFGLPSATNGVKQTVIFDPSQPKGSATRWTVGASAIVGRHYHNTALLLEDGTVITGGGDSQNGADIMTVRPDDMTLDIYSPPYKSIPNPPVFANISSNLFTYGQQIVVPFASPVAQTIANVSMIRYASVTHSTNLDQRHIELQIVSYQTDRLLVQLPANANIAAPGNWMLWAVDSRGAPAATALTINLRAGNPNTAPVWDTTANVAVPTFGPNGRGTPAAAAPVGTATNPGSSSSNTKQSDANGNRAVGSALVAAVVAIVAGVVMA